MTEQTPKKPIVVRIHDAVRRRRRIGVVFISAVCIAAMYLLFGYVTDGGNLSQVGEVQIAPRNHAVRSHGWGSRYIYSGRSHYGGGGRIH